MARPLPVDYLQPGEERLLTTGRHHLSVLDEILFILSGWIAVVVALAVVSALPRVPDLARTLAVTASAVATVIALSLIVVRIWRYQTTRFIVTPERVYKSYGRFRFFLLQTTYDKITDLHVHQSLFGRLWGFGTVTLQTAGTGLALNGVRDPLAIKSRIEEARTAFLETLVAEYGATHAATAPASAMAPELAPDARTTQAPLWKAGPTLASFLGALATLGFVAIGAFAFMTVSAASGRIAFFGPVGILVVFGAITLLSAWIQYNFTRYEVHPWGVVVTSGWLSRRRVETTYDKVTDVATAQTVMGRLLGYGTITVNTAGSNQAPVVFRGIADPEQAKGIIDEARRMRRRGP